MAQPGHGHADQRIRTRVDGRHGERRVGELVIRPRSKEAVRIDVHADPEGDLAEGAERHRREARRWLCGPCLVGVIEKRFAVVAQDGTGRGDGDGGIVFSERISEGYSFIRSFTFWGKVSWLDRDGRGLQLRGGDSFVISGYPIVTWQV